MKSKTLILMFVAIACGLVASYMTSRVIAERNTKEAEPERVEILVAKQKIPMGTLLKEPDKYFTTKSVVKGEDPKDSIRNLDDLKGRTLNKPIRADACVFKDDLISSES